MVGPGERERQTSFTGRTDTAEDCSPKNTQTVWPCLLTPQTAKPRSRKALKLATGHTGKVLYDEDWESEVVLFKSRGRQQRAKVLTTQKPLDLAPLAWFLIFSLSKLLLWPNTCSPSPLLHKARILPGFSQVAGCGGAGGTQQVGFWKRDLSCRLHQ